MALNLVSNSGFDGNKGSKLISAIGAGRFGLAKFDEAASTGATFSTATNVAGSGKNYRVARFTSNGTLVFSKAGLIDALLVGGGGGGSGGTGGARTGGAGGGGQALQVANFYISLGSHSIVIGQGGAGGGYTAPGSRGGTTRLGSLLMAHGGAGGASNFGANSGGNGGDIIGPAATNGAGYFGSSVAPFPGFGGGGGGGGGAGGNASGHTAGIGLTINFDGTSTVYGRGGDGHSSNINNGIGGGGNSTASDSSGGFNGFAGIVLVRIEI